MSVVDVRIVICMKKRSDGGRQTANSRQTGTVRRQGKASSKPGPRLDSDQSPWARKYLTICTDIITFNTDDIMPCRPFRNGALFFYIAE